MCIGCYEKLEGKTIINEKTKMAASLIDEVYDYSAVGGNAHIVLDDWNLEDHHIKWCIYEAIPENFHKYSDPQLEAEKACLYMLLGMSMEERISALAIHDGFVNDEGEAEQ